MKIIAHRGIHYNKTAENTMDAFNQAIELGCDYIEFDVRETKYKQLVVHHDPYISKRHKKTYINQTDYNELIKLKEIPLLDEVLSLSDKINFNLEIKETGYEEAVYEKIKELKNHIIISSFKSEVIKEIKEYNLPDNIETGLLLGSSDNSLQNKIDEIYFENRTVSNKADYVIIKNNFEPFARIIGDLTNDYVKSNLKIIIWNTNNKKSINKYLKKDIYAIITDRPDIAKNKR